MQRQDAWALMGGLGLVASVDQPGCDGPREVRSSHSRMFEQDENYLLVHYGAWSGSDVWGSVPAKDSGDRYFSWMGIRSGLRMGYMRIILLWR